MLRCSDHPKYKAVNTPRKTKKYPDGCPACWWVWAFKEFSDWKEVHYSAVNKSDEAIALGSYSKEL